MSDAKKLNPVEAAKVASRYLRGTIAEELQRHVIETELKGYHCPWLAPEHAGAEARADAIVAEARLGAADAAAEEAVFTTYVADCRTRLAAFGVALPAFETNRLPAF